MATIAGPRKRMKAVKKPSTAFCSVKGVDQTLGLLPYPVAYFIRGFLFFSFSSDFLRLNSIAATRYFLLFLIISIFKSLESPFFIGFIFLRPPFLEVMHQDHLPNSALF